MPPAIAEPPLVFLRPTGCAFSLLLCDAEATTRGAAAGFFVTAAAGGGEREPAAVNVRRPPPLGTKRARDSSPPAAVWLWLSLSLPRLRWRPWQVMARIVISSCMRVRIRIEGRLQATILALNPCLTALGNRSIQ